MFFFGFIQIASAKDNIACEAKHSLYHNDIEIKSTYKFVMDSGNGIILINGTSRTEGSRYTISREIHFKYKKQNGGVYYFTSNRIYKNPIDTLPKVLAEKHYPKFFIEANNNLTFIISPVNKLDYIITFVSTPLFYCSGK